MHPTHDSDPITGHELIVMVATVLLGKAVELAAKTLNVFWHRRPRTIHGSGTLEAHGTLTAHGEVIPLVVGTGPATVTATAHGGRS